MPLLKHQDISTLPLEEAHTDLQLHHFPVFRCSFSNKDLSYVLIQ
jgi:hypothetical protein